MSKPTAMLYNLDAVVRGDVAGDIVKLLQNGQGTVLRLVPHHATITTNGHRHKPAPRARYVPPKILDKSKIREARDVVYSTLKQTKGPVRRQIITKALVSKGYSEYSIGPICHLLARDGIIHSPRRGFWQVK